MSTQEPPAGGNQNPNEPTSSGLPPYGASGADQPGGGYGAPQETNKKALWSMITGILGIVCCGPLAIVALVLANSSRKEIAQTGQGGSGMATAGWWLGIVGIALWVLGIALYALGVLTFGLDTSTS